MKIYLSLLLSLILCAACTKRTAVIAEKLDQSQTETHYADLLQIQELEEGRVLCRILDPWRTENVVAQYLLVPREDQHWNEEVQQKYDSSYGASALLCTPLCHMTLTSACHAWLMHELGAMEQVAVMCDSAYVMSSEVKQWLRSHPEVKDGGTSATPNTEVIMQAQCDAIWISPFENASTNALSLLPVPMIYCADYMENSPLGRAEWMRFYGLLVGKGEEADDLFRSVESRYNGLATDTKKKTLLPELPYGPTWYVPGGRSTSSLLYQDAGFVYPWAEDTHAGSLSLSPESVLAKACDCDVWYFKYMNTEGNWTRDEFLSQNPIYAQFKAAKDGELWGCNTAVSDFFDVTPFRPDLLLKSMVEQDGRFFSKLK